MSSLILQPGKYEIPMGPVDRADPQPARDEEFEAASDEQKGRQLPVPQGYKILCVIPRAEEHFEGSTLVKPDSVRKAEEWGTTVLFVVALGELAYKDDSKFPKGPWCKKGDFILTRTYSGTRFRVAGKEFRLLNDDQVEAVVEDPRGIMRAAA